MRRFGKIAVIAASVIAAASFVSADARKPTRADAESLVNRGVELFRQQGPEAGIRTVNERTRPFLDGELYLFVIGPDGSIVAHANEESRVGIAADELYDDQGQPYGKLMIKLANDKGVWIPYRQFNPVSKKVEPKTSFVRKADGYIFGCGVYGK